MKQARRGARLGMYSVSRVGRWSWISLLFVACNPAISGRIDDYGVTADLSAPIQLDNPSLPGGTETFVDKMRIARTGDRIEAKLGTSFGYQFTIAGLRPGSEYLFEKTVSHPPMKLPDGTVSNGYSRMLRPALARSDGTVASIQGYSLDFDYELLPGPWTIEIKHDGQTLTTKTFTLITADEAP